MATELIGYCDKFSVAPGEKLAFKVSTDLARYEVAVVRLIHGDENPAGPGYKEEVVSTPIEGAYPGRRQEIHCGSWLTVPDRPALRNLKSLTLQAWIFPTGTGRGERQGLISKWWSTDRAGYGLGLGPGGDLELRVGCPDGHGYRLSTGRALRRGHWYFVAATIDVPSRQVLLCQHECFGPGPDTTSCSATGTLPRRAALDSNAPLLMAAGCACRLDGRILGKELYDGKLERPSFFRRGLGIEELEQLRQGGLPLEVDRQDLVAAWDFSREMHTSRVRDLGPNELHATAVNMPSRAVTGHNWSGRETDFNQSPAEYGAIHFHGDDLEDAAWRTDFTLEVPPHAQERDLCGPSQGRRSGRSHPLLRQARRGSEAGSGGPAGPHPDLPGLRQREDGLQPRPGGPDGQPAATQSRPERPLPGGPPGAVGLPLRPSPGRKRFHLRLPIATHRQPAPQVTSSGGREAPATWPETSTWWTGWKPRDSTATSSPTRTCTVKAWTCCGTTGSC